MHSFATSACRKPKSTSPFLFPLAFPLVIGRREVYCPFTQWGSHEKQMDFKIDIITDALRSLLSYCKDLMRVVEIPSEAVKANLHLPQPCVTPPNVSMRTLEWSLVCAPLKVSSWPGLTSAGVPCLLAISHSRLHWLGPSQAGTPWVFVQASPCLHSPSLLLLSPLYGWVLLLNAPSLSHLCFPKAAFLSSTTDSWCFHCRRLSCVLQGV